MFSGGGNLNVQMQVVSNKMVFTRESMKSLGQGLQNFREEQSKRLHVWYQNLQQYNRGDNPELLQEVHRITADLVTLHTKIA